MSPRLPIHWNADLNKATYSATDAGSVTQYDNAINQFTASDGGVQKQAKYANADNIFAIEGAANVWVLNAEGEIQWTYDTEGVRAFDAVVDSSGNIIVSGWRANNASLWKLDSAGSLQWDYDTGDDTYNVAVDGGDNVIVAGKRSGGYSVWKLSSGGAFQWGYDTGNAARGITADNNNNLIVTGSVNASIKNVWKLSAGGGYLWDYHTLGNTAYAAIANSTGDIYIATYATTVGKFSIVKLSAAGTFQWGHTVAGPAYPHGYDISVDDGGYVYFVGNRANSKSLWKVTASGTSEWSIDTGGGTSGVVIDGLEGVLVGGTRVGTASAWLFDSAGAEQWSYDTGSTVRGVGYADGIYCLAGERVT